ncbi:hypothetical protein COMA1_80044 [Candidatus Nitrospira nitrosa]|uniref:Uncharacterized protein n=1 Tax=Candidatus Nitrospira nitrosa TaxID=1742972 RepID=A0A0S4LTZ5_9BACT|nr:hypothetical protein [Candidatus Nitrospira nitrosa]CUS39476.1 hypothetical protein COMA1_80044 [Candidatus Nitrospira nitrosa]
MQLRAQLATIGEVGACVLFAARHLRGRTVKQRAGPIDPVGTVELRQQHFLQLQEHAIPMPLLELT